MSQESMFNKWLYYPPPAKVWFNASGSIYSDLLGKGTHKI